MSDTTVGLIGLALMFLLLAIRMPVAVTMITVGVGGIAVLNSWDAAFGTLIRPERTLAFSAAEAHADRKAWIAEWLAVMGE